jgi:hypothetical protein
MIKVAIAIIAFASVTFAQYPKDVTVFRASAETADAVVFQISTRKKVYAPDENIDVRFLVQNKGKKTIYLVINPATQMRISESWIVELPDPVEGPDAHIPYRYRMIKILPGKSYNGKRTVEAKKLQEHKKYGFNVVEIQVGFAYLFDISQLTACDQYSLPCLSEVWEKGRIVKLGNLIVERTVE